MTRTLTAALILLLALGAPVLAQSYGQPSTGLNDRTTKRVVRLLEKGLKQCQALESVYRYDCYRQNYNTAARELDGKPAYAPAQKALRDVEGTLQRVLAANADPTAQQVRRRGKTFSAITADATPAAKAAFRDALDQAATQLLRSPDTGGDHFARIAGVLDSNKVFLRS